MREYQVVANIRVYDYDELDENDRNLVDKAREMTYRSYAPYSRFYVGAALQLKNGIVVPGCNQENAATPAGICAERSAIFAAGAAYPDEPILTIAIAARNENGFMASPIPPCGICRQVILETEQKYKQPIRLLLVSSKEIHVVNGINDLLPLQFIAESML